MAEAQEIDRIERELAVTLPQYFRNFLADFPLSLIDAKTDLGWKQEAPADREFRNDPDQIIYWNRHVRHAGTPWTDDDGPWPEKYFVIGDDECGNFWAIDLESDDEAVWFYDHDCGRFERQCDSLPAFQAALLKKIAEFNAENGKGDSN